MATFAERETTILSSVLDAVGCTPCIRLNRMPEWLGFPQYEWVAKCEFMNPGGSVKDRIGREMVLAAEADGTLSPGDTIVEPTSGNTGIGLAMASAARGYRCVITMPNKMSAEKQRALCALGAQVMRTPTEAAFDAPESHISLAYRLRDDDAEKRTKVLDQYRNPHNPLAHERGTGPEIVKQCGGKVDLLVATAGTGGTVTGIARALKAAIPTARVVGVDPEGSILAGPGPIGTYDVEGIGYDFIPDVLDRSVVDVWARTKDPESFAAARAIIALEGLLVGGSSGAVLAGAVNALRAMDPPLPAGSRIVVVLPDGIRNYMSKFADDAWLAARHYPVPAPTHPILPDPREAPAPAAAAEAKPADK